MSTQSQIRAVLSPRRTDDLKPHVIPHIGELHTWIFVGHGGEDEPYPGQARWWCLTADIGWVPDCDLDRLIPPVRDKVNPHLS